MSSIFETKRLQDWANLVLGALLFISPWVLGYSADAYAGWTAWIGGILIAALAVAALAAFAQWEEWVNLALGVLVLVSPWVLGFAANLAALWAHVVLGLLVAVLAAWELWQVGQKPHATA
jgi:uncharacterized membrane protein HdeD (DUF308 family)